MPVCFCFSYLNCLKAWNQLHWGIFFFFFFKLFLPFPANKHFQQQSVRLARVLVCKSDKILVPNKVINQSVFITPKYSDEECASLCQCAILFWKKDKTMEERGKERRSNRDYRLNTLNTLNKDNGLCSIVWDTTLNV